MKLKETMKINDVARYLTRLFPQKDHRQWWGYLKWNVRRWKQQDGILINCQKIEGKLIYTADDVKAFEVAFDQLQQHKAVA